jgi:hypothetical protein
MPRIVKGMRHKALIIGGALAIVLVSLAILARSLKVPIELNPAQKTENGEHAANVEAINAAAATAGPSTVTQEDMVQSILAAQARANQADTQ